MVEDLRSVAEAIDEHVGQKLRSARKLCGISQGALGTRCGLSFQQIQKFEAGSIRISAGRLKQVADILGVPIEFFFDGISADGTTQPAFAHRMIDLAKHSEVKSHCMRLIAAADEDDIAPLCGMLERLTAKRDGDEG